MIVILRSADLVKIDYAETQESVIEKIQEYNPTAEILYSYPEGTLRDVVNLRNYFRNIAQGDHGWFHGTKDMIKFFNTNQDMESIRSIIPEVTEKEVVIDQDLTLVITRVVYPDSLEMKEHILKVLLGWRSQDLEKVVRIEFPEYFPDIMSMYDHVKEGLTEKEVKFLHDISLPHDKVLKFICQYGLHDEEKKVYFFLEHRLRVILSYFDERTIKAYDYNAEKLWKEYQVRTISTLPEVRRAVYETFKFGDRVTFAFVKEALGKIYRAHGYPKAVTSAEIRTYYEVTGMDDTRDRNSRKRGYTLGRPLCPEAEEIIGIQQDTLRQEILRRFKVGDILFVDDILTRLQDIYDLLGYKKSPKPGQLSEWFEMKTLPMKRYRIIRCLWNNNGKYDNLKDDIYSTFSPGQVLTNAKIEELLGEIYRKNNYVMSPKASEVGLWFKIKVRKIDFEPGYKLISRI